MERALFLITILLMLAPWVASADGAVVGSRSLQTRLVKSVAPKADENQLFLYDVETNHADRVKDPKKLLPWRVYLVPDGSGPGGYGYALTSSEGKLPRPLEFFRERSILAGGNLGARVPIQNYELTKEGAWVPTAMLERFFFWVQSAPPVIKVVGWYELPADRAIASTKGDGHIDLASLQEYDGRTNTAKSVERGRKIFPNRVYRVLGPSGPSFVLSNFEGRFPAPVEYLKDGAVLSGNYLGAPYGYGRFLLTEKGTWARTEKPEVHLTYTDANPRHIRAVTFIAPDSQK